MFQKLITYFQFGNYFCGIEHASNNNQDYILGTLLKRSKKEVVIASTFEENSIDDLTKSLPKKQHAFLIINNNNILTKSIESSQKDSVNIVNKAFPNINIDDFFYEIIIQDTICFVSICRRDYITQLIDNYKSKGVLIINISLGNLLISSLSDFVKTEFISSSNAIVYYNNKVITSIEKTSKNEVLYYNINGLETNNKSILSLSGALASVLNHFKPTSNLENLKESLFIDFKHFRFFNQFIKFGLIFFLGILLINFFVFNHYFEKVNRLQETSQINQITKNRVLELNKTISKKQSIVDDILKSNSSKSSFYVNALIQGLPDSILLSELNFQPLIKRIKNNEKINNDLNTILISGESTDSDLFSKWITDLETITWISKVGNIHYTNSSKSTSSFNMKINIINE